MSDTSIPTPYPRAQRLMLVAAVLIGTLVFDHATKWAAVAWLKTSPPIIYIGDLFRFQYATNTGAFLSLFGSLPPAARSWLLVGFNALILSGVGVYLVSRANITRWTAVALALILAGGVGNLIDRVCRGGIVVDFMNVGITLGKFTIRSGIFNVADLGIVGGLVLLVGIEVFGRRAPAPTQ